MLSTHSFVYSQGITGTTYYIDSNNGNDSGSGTSSGSPWRSLAKIRGTSLKPGDRVLLKRGTSWSEELIINSPGTAAKPIMVGAYGSGSKPVILSLLATQDHVTYEGIIVDHQKQSGDAVRVRGAQHNTFRGMTVRNGTSDGIDGDKANNVLIENCHIHHFLAGSFSSQVDGHGIVFTDTQGIIIRGTEVHHVSGDSFQTDPDRDGNTPDDILIEDCHFWTGPLSQNFNSGWRSGQSPGENAIDTKMLKTDWNSVPRMRITVKNTIAHGFTNNGFIDNRAVFNMKEKVEAIFDGVTIYDSEIGFRLRGTRGNANVTIKNAVMYNCEKAIRAEDNLANLVVHNSTFGESIAQALRFAGGSGGTSSWDWRNNAFIGTVPAIASSPTNMSASSNDFMNTTNNDYRLATGSSLINRGTTIVSVATDRDGATRSNPYDVGAYKFMGSTPKKPEAPVSLSAIVLSSSEIRLNWVDNATDETRFRIDRKTGNESFSKIATVGANTVHYEDIGLEAGITYSYRVRAENSAGNSDYSNITTNTTKSESVTFPVVLQGRNLPETATVDLQVDKPSGAEGIAKITMMVFDADNSNEGTLEINGNPPIQLFGDQGTWKNDRKTLAISFDTPTEWWRDGTNSLRFSHTRTGGFRVDSAWVEFDNISSGFPVVLQSRNLPEEATASLQIDKPSGTIGTAILTLTVFDPDGADEGELEINGNGPLQLFGREATWRNDRKTIDIALSTPAVWWNDGVNTLRFVHTKTGGYRVENASVDFGGTNLAETASVSVKSSRSSQPLSTNSLANLSKDATESANVDQSASAYDSIFSTVYEDAEDGSISGWFQYNGGSVKNIIGGANGSPRAIEINGDIKNDVFRLANEDGSDWNNETQFFLEFSIALDQPGSGAIYVQLDTSLGTKFLVYNDNSVSENYDPDLIHMNIGDISDGQWHKVLRNLEEDLITRSPDAQLYSIESLFVYGSAKLDSVSLHNIEFSPTN